MDYPNDKEVLESFSCSQTVSFSYHTAHISQTARALSSSTKTSLRIDEGGLLSLQFLMPSPVSTSGGKKSEAFIEFRVCGLISVLSLRMHGSDVHCWFFSVWLWIMMSDIPMRSYSGTLSTRPHYFSTLRATQSNFLNHLQVIGCSSWRVNIECGIISGVYRPVVVARFIFILNGFWILRWTQNN